MKNDNNKNLNEPLISTSKNMNKKPKNEKTIEISKFKQNQNQQKFIYPPNFFSQIFFTWTTNILKLSNSQSNKLKPNHFGTFNPNQTSTFFLNKIKPTIKKLSNSKNFLLKSLIYTNLFNLILIIIISIFVVFLDTLTIIFFHQILLYFDEKNEEFPTFNLFNTILLLIIDKIIYIFSFRFLEFYTSKLSSKITITINSLLFDKILVLSPFENNNFYNNKNNINFRKLIEFIQNDIEKISDFFSYVPATFILPFQISFFIYLLLQYFGPSFLFGMFFLILILPLNSFFINSIFVLQNKLLFLKRKRIKTTSEVFDKILTVKINNFEEFFIKKIKEKRNDELLILNKLEKIKFFINSFFSTTGMFLSLISIISYILFDNKLDVSSILTSLYIFNQLGEPLFLLPEYVMGFLKSLESLKKIEDFLQRKNGVNNINNDDDDDDKKDFAIKINGVDFGIVLKFNNDDDNSDSNDNISDDDKNDKSEFDNSNFSSINNEDSEEVISNNSLNIKKVSSKLSNIIIDSSTGIESFILLKNINLEIKTGELVAIIGEIGSGKTLLLNSILNNLDIISPKNISKKNINISGKIAYVSQSIFLLQNESIRSNILFFKEFNKEKYNLITETCLLSNEFDSFPNGDLTEINSKHIQLTSSQKIKISIARALYSESEIYLFDDFFKSLNDFEDVNLFNNVIINYLNGKTIVFVTHALQFIFKFDKIVFMKDGKIEWFGKAKDFEKEEFYKEFEKLSKKKKNKSNKNILNLENKNNFNNNHNENIININNENINNSNKKIKKIKIEDEYFHSTSNKFQIYLNLFLYSGGIFFFILLILFNIFWKFSEFSCDYFLTFWSMIKNFNQEQNFFYLYIYSFISILSIIFIFIRNYVIFSGILIYNKTMHNKLLIKLLQAPIFLFHYLIPKNQISYVLNKDLGNSIKFFWAFNESLRLLFHLIACVLVSIFFNLNTIFLFPILFFGYYKFFTFYLNGNKYINHSESLTISQISTILFETFSGLSTIRTYNAQEKFREKFHLKLDDFYKCLLFQSGTSSWFALNIDLTTFSYLFLILIYCLIFRSSLNILEVGLLLTYTLKLLENSFNFFENYTKLEKHLINIERCEKFTHIIQEKNFFNKNDKKYYENINNFKGKIIFLNYNVKYRPDSNVVLKNINIEIKNGEKIAIVGKNGSGKTTFAFSLLRILEPFSGKILIDDIDITGIGLKFLRKKLVTYVSKDAQIFEGNLKENLDPMNMIKNEEIIKEIKLFGLDYLVENENLDFFINEGGSNLSFGEKQLICILRTFLNKTKILIMDEATGSLDYKTEDLIQNIIKEKLKETTIINIPHRIKTVLNYDKVFVLEKGEIVETGKPNELINNKKGIFYDLFTKSNI